MTPLEALLRDEILRAGPIPFHRFMQAALYHPEYGYYRRARDPFGRAGDYYTAEQIQPVFGILAAQAVRSIHEEMGSPGEFTIVELGAGRAEMAEAFSEFRYVPVEIGRGTMPERFTGVVFANEFFDALPVHVAALRAGEWRERLVDWREGRFSWVHGSAAAGDVRNYLRSYSALEEEGAIGEANLEASEWIGRIAARLERGWLLAIDYGYTTRESLRFPCGTLMSYRHHRADEDVLAAPGERDITAHVSFSALEDRGRRAGFHSIRLESLAQFLLAAGERDQFRAALDADAPKEETRRRLQLKSLLFGMGESFRVLRMAKGNTAWREK